MMAPAEWPGTEEERVANRGTHRFDAASARCMDCDCRPFGRVADWPCGEDPPRVEDPNYTGVFLSRAAAYFKALPVD